MLEPEASVSRRLLVIGANEYVLRSAQGLPLEIVLLTSVDRLDRAASALASVSVIGKSLNDPAIVRIASQLHGHEPFDGLVSFTEDGLEIAAMIRERLGLHGTPPLVTAVLRDKGRMREILGDSPLSAQWRLIQDAEDAECFLSELDGPAVIKPLRGSGSKAVVAVDQSNSETQIANILATANGPVLMEERVFGRELSIETMSYAGSHHVLLVVDKDMGDSFRPKGHVAPAELDDEARCRVTTAVCDFLDLVGLRDGPAHTEVVLTDTGVKVIESHDRPAGGWVTELIRLCTGIDMYEVALAAASGLVRWPRRGVSEQAHVGALVYFGAEPGVIESISGVGDALSDQHVHGVLFDKDVGDIHMNLEDEERVGGVLASGSTSSEARNTALAAVQRLRVHVRD